MKNHNQSDSNSDTSLPEDKITLECEESKNDFLNEELDSKE